MTPARRRTATAVTGLLLGAVLAVAGCSGGGDDSPTATLTSSDDPAPTPTDGTTSGPTSGSTSSTGSTGSTDDDGDPSAPPFAADASPDTADPSADASLTVSDVRVGRHDGFDRVVFELGGTGTPGWRVEYVQDAVDDPSGQVLDVDGDGTLQVILTGTGYPTDTGVPEYAGANPLRVGGTESVEEVWLRGVFEGQTLAFVGVDDDATPFRVYLLQDPVRVVLEVADAG